MKVSLLDWTGAGFNDPFYAADLLIFTKQTRTMRDAAGLWSIRAWPEEKKLEELRYMVNTIQTSWEMVDYTFFAEGVTRSLTHQLVRTRFASYAQQTLQIMDVSGFEYHVGPSIESAPTLKLLYEEEMARIDSTYRFLIKHGASIEDAREMLPHGLLTSITFKMNLRILIDLIKSREGPRNLQMFRDLVVTIREKMLSVHPWLNIFMERELDQVLRELEDEVKALPIEDDVGGPKFSVLKKLDQIKRLT